MTKIYVGAGHGKSIYGGYDPGAISRGHVEEKLNEKVCVATGEALLRCGFRVKYDTSAEERSYVEAARAANTWGADYAMEIHHDIGTGHSLALVHENASEDTRETARRIVRRLSLALGTTYAGIIARDREYFNRATNMPSSIVEVSCLNGDDAIIDRLGANYATLAGEAIAKAMCVTYNKVWVAPDAMTFRQWLRYRLRKRSVKGA